MKVNVKLESDREDDSQMEDMDDEDSASAKK